MDPSRQEIAECDCNGGDIPEAPYAISNPCKICESLHCLMCAGGSTISAVEQQHKPLAHLMEFPFFAAEVESDAHAFFEGLFKWWAGRYDFARPQGSDADWGGMP